jgi:hypothetical protein
MGIAIRFEQEQQQDGQPGDMGNDGNGPMIDYRGTVFSAEAAEVSAGNDFEIAGAVEWYSP